MNRLINDIVVSTKKTARTVINHKKTVTLHKKHSISDRNISKKSNLTKIITTLFVLLCVVAVFFSVSMIFTSATVTITPKIESISFNNEKYTAKTKTFASQDFPFEVMTINKSIYKSVEATGEKHVELKAMGQITIINNYSSQDQKLSSSTRFSSPAGNVYRTTNDVIVPGKTKINNKDIPGKVVVNIVADKAGDSYNINSIDLKDNFKIVAFKGTAKYDGFYATLNGNITGGFIGQQKTISQDKEIEYINDIKNELTTLLKNEFKNTKPESFLSFDNLSYIDFGNVIETNDGNKLKIGIEGVFNAIMFNKNKFSNFLAIQKIHDYNKQPLNVITGNDFSIKIVSTSTKPWIEKSLDLVLNGSIKFKWIYDGEAIKTELVGKNLIDLENIKEKYSGNISDITASFNPFWQRLFPDNASKIEIKELQNDK